MIIKNIYRKIIPEKVRLFLINYKRKVIGLFLWGDSFYCVCCNHSFRKFLKKGNGIQFRDNAVCPNCGSLERTRLLYLYLKNETTIFSGNPKVLHVAPEESLKNYFSKNPNYIDVDLNPNLARYKMDITALDFKDEMFDFIICSHVLGHIPDDNKAIQELYRVLKNNGLLFILSLVDPNLEITLENKLICSEAEKL
jgi:SAM-dependent methyltransferase